MAWHAPESDPAPDPYPPCEPAEPHVRQAGRVILLDPQDDVLLLRYDELPPIGRHWATPGGGLNPGEDYAAGALRELAEETGWSDIALLGEVHRYIRVIRRASHVIRQHERLYLARTDQDRREIRGVETMHDSDSIAAWRWWSLTELDATDETVWPAGLADLIRNALRAGDARRDQQAP